ncbi:MAG: hypothetical protein OJF49_003267 [Ktedonobacterales bacterium]|jgi:hypothetical protein|nr:MAG: hypothetical protein OJF49_003267 [Ktedonobacterales bacterium]
MSQGMSEPTNQILGAIEVESLWGEPVMVEVNRKGQRKLAMWASVSATDAERAATLRERDRERAREREKARRHVGNPLLPVYGVGPVGATCKTCVQLVRVEYHDKTYYKCTLRGYSHGTATDQRVGWSACGRYVCREGDVRTQEVW